MFYYVNIAWYHKSNAKWWKIRMKTRNLTQSRIEMIQLIVGFKAFHFAIS